MACPNFEETREQMLEYLRSKLSDFFIGDSDGQNIELLPHPRYGNVLFPGTEVDLKKSQMPPGFAFVGEWLTVWSYRADSRELQRRELNRMLSDIVDAMKPPWQGSPFGISYCTTAYFKSARLYEDSQVGLYWEISIHMELEEV